MRHGIQGATHAKLLSFTKREFQSLLHTVEMASYSVEGSRVYSELRYLAIKHLADKLIARHSGSESELANAAEALMLFARAEHGWWCDRARFFRSWYQEWQHGSLAKTDGLENQLACAKRLEDSVGLVCAAAGGVEALVDICHSGAYEGREDGSAEECVRLAIVTCHMALDAPRCDAIMRDVTRLLLGDPDISGALELIASCAGTGTARIVTDMSLQGRLFLTLACGLLWKWDEEWVVKEDDERLRIALSYGGAGCWAFDVTELARPYEDHISVATYAKQGLAKLGLDDRGRRAVISTLCIPDSEAAIVTSNVAIALACAIGIVSDTRLTLLAYDCFHSALTDTVEFDPVETLRMYLPNPV